ncbi:uncharacterized protein L3040_006068 [Drepanopeziza brunnea f. sp. 'multigermtubi']|uniref:LysM10p n=2 Tax=Drepanopeziza brunnea f. sp. 'multigermtubi' TaxID=698441 RepID=J9XN32_9HELO|nr:putative Ecp7(P20) [Drepanopeziza brunnea f. sp. 'multigermtubi' MB_m1]AFS30728.1 LysM10p [Drepanopeziza brunnea f. sp. 'multigermtubi']EKD21554.1 putative Ecp7(P20) [Drepanopeziza brunnea f. sp. 'multigermtubi' MB_m1]KAJ5040412.1 hypothetical protein L3040_006068 [Drepanopeziza brunnea f. sp. 'multigermtubi']
MHFNNNLLLLAFFGAATALRRTCKVDNIPTKGSGTYTAKGTDTWRNIAADFCTDLGELEARNNVSPIKEGNIIRVPCRARPRDCLRIPNENVGYYTVAQGDTIDNIASDFCSDAKNLSFLNPDVIKDNSVSQGKVIKVPCSWN